jgi:acyl carrier protein
MDVKATTRKFLALFFKNHDIADDEDIFASGFVNSLFVIRLVTMVEREFGVEVGDDDLDFDNFRTLDAIAGFVARKQSAPAGI